MHRSRQGGGSAIPGERDTPHARLPRLPGEGGAVGMRQADPLAARTGGDPPPTHPRPTAPRFGGAAHRLLSRAAGQRRARRRAPLAHRHPPLKPDTDPGLLKLATTRTWALRKGCGGALPGLADSDGPSVPTGCNAQGTWTRRLWIPRCGRRHLDGDTSSFPPWPQHTRLRVRVAATDSASSLSRAPPANGALPRARSHRRRVLTHGAARQRAPRARAAALHSPAPQTSWIGGPRRPCPAAREEVICIALSTPQARGALDGDCPAPRCDAVRYVRSHSARTGRPRPARPAAGPFVCPSGPPSPRGSGGWGMGPGAPPDSGGLTEGSMQCTAACEGKGPGRRRRFGPQLPRASRLRRTGTGERSHRRHQSPIVGERGGRMAYRFFSGQQKR